ncbi:hypothetical protein KQQSB11_130018 [Klebsiella quasipneumoniae subsp. quasipneumoniae]|nr:hypothetical protein KQQSB11_130018 [Klebsiella quasipneumoniae subsp. quasipneumoniae]
MTHFFCDPSRFQPYLLCSFFPLFTGDPDADYLGPKNFL